MAEYCISCCSTADLTKEYFDKRGIHYVCFHYELGGKDYLDDLGQTMSPAELYRRMLAGEDVRHHRLVSVSMQIFLEKYLMRERISFI